MLIAEVPHQGSARVVSDLIGGHVDAAGAMIVPFVQPANSGGLRLLAVTTKEGSPAAPDVPTIAESTTLKDFDVANWSAMLTPPGTPELIVTKLATAIEEAFKHSDVQKTFPALGLAPATRVRTRLPNPFGKISCNGAPLWIGRVLVRFD